MKTQDLIRAMAADETRALPVRVALPLALLGAAAVAGAVFYAAMGMRPDLMEALGRLQVLLKQAFPIVMTVAAFGAVARLSRPDGALGGWGWALMIAPAIVAISFWITAVSMPMAQWPEAIRGQNAGACLVCIPLIGLPILAASLWALGHGATTRLRLSGALAGLLAGSASAAVYAAHCTDDSPMFWGVWYVLAIGAVTGLGALLGPRLLRW